MIAQEQPEQMEQIGDAVVHRRGGDEQGARADDELRERAVTVGVGVSEPVSLVDDEKPDGRTDGRADCADAE